MCFEDLCKTSKYKDHQSEKLTDFCVQISLIPRSLYSIELLWQLQPERHNNCESIHILVYRPAGYHDY